MNKKSQVWTIEFILSFLIFTAAILLSVKSVVNVYANDNIIEVQGDSESISQYLLSQGYPEDWDESNVIRPGISTNNRINETKLSNFYFLDYQQTKNYFGLRSDFFIYFENASGTIPLFNIVNNSISEGDGCGYGHQEVIKNYDASLGTCTFDLSALEYDDLAKISRLTIYNSSIIKMTILAWR
ncbi:MAG: hypothetical protein ACP5NV_02915 [Candidatus Woesearchaeota archaeon]